METRENYKINEMKVTKKINLLKNYTFKAKGENIHFEYIKWLAKLFMFQYMNRNLSSLFMNKYFTLIPRNSILDAKLTHIFLFLTIHLI